MIQDLINNEFKDRNKVSCCQYCLTRPISYKTSVISSFNIINMLDFEGNYIHNNMNIPLPGILFRTGEHCDKISVK